MSFRYSRTNVCAIRKKLALLRTISSLSKFKLAFKCPRCTVDDSWPCQDVSSSFDTATGKQQADTLVSAIHILKGQSLCSNTFFRNLSSGRRDKNQSSKKLNVNIFIRMREWKPNAIGGWLNYGKSALAFKISCWHGMQHYVGIQVFKQYQVEMFNCRKHICLETVWGYEHRNISRCRIEAIFVFMLWWIFLREYFIISLWNNF